MMLWCCCVLLLWKSCKKKNTIQYSFLEEFDHLEDIRAAWQQQQRHQQQQLPTATAASSAAQPVPYSYLFCCLFVSLCAFCHVDNVPTKQVVWVKNKNSSIWIIVDIFIYM